MMLTHWSAAPLDKITSANDPEGTDAGPFTKPKGLWLSDESDYGWQRWCLAEDFGLDSLRHRKNFDVDMTDVCLLSSSKDLLDFTKAYGRPDRFLNSRMRIPWREVAKHWKGIVITPYCWPLRLDLNWYYGWDCASGCIWDVTCLTPVVPLLEEAK